MTKPPYGEGPAGSPEMPFQQNPDTTPRLGKAGLEATFNTESSVSPEVNKLPSPSEIPDLLPHLSDAATEHRHMVDDSITIYTKLREAENTEPLERTAEQAQLLEDVAILKRFAPHAMAYEDVYTPDELHRLVVKLELLGQKNRPDFNDVEGRILDVVLSAEGELSTSLIGIAKRASDNISNRRGMQWTTLIKLAGSATWVMHDKMLRSPNRQGYIISVEDPEPQRGNDLTPVYQFVANSHAYDVLAERILAVRGQRQETFVANCEVINAWYEAAAPIIKKLPVNFTGSDKLPAGWEINNLIETMNTRLTSTDRSGRDKSYKVDSVGAINLQKRIGNLVATIKQKLEVAGQPDETEITPLE
jgi:hypothetical protein